jgi:two-component system, NtrC family, nitrogen regulation sensor histidine kinase NtrY
VIPGLGSLRSRIFLASTVLATASIGAALYFVSALITARAEEELQRDLGEAVTLVTEQSARLFDDVTRTATLVADLPKFKAAIETRDPPTVEPIARDYLEQTGADLIVVVDRDGRHLAVAQNPHSTATTVADHASLPADRPGAAYRPHPAGVLQTVTVPVTIDRESPERLGTLTLGYLLDSARAEELGRVTGADIAFAYGGRLRAWSFAAERVPAVTGWFSASTRPAVLRLGSDDFSALASPMVTDDGAPGAAGPHTIVLRSRTERMRTLGTIRTAMAGLALATIALAAVLSYFLARSVTRPLATITAHMREAAATGDLTRKVRLADSTWADEDAVLVADTFNALTESVATAQRDAAQRERLSALGRLSTVIAHEIRNPLMIIKGALRQLTRPDATSDDARDAAHDIDDEVNRLNRVVNEVLDFARPIRFDFSAAVVNDICQSAREAVVAAHPCPEVSLDLDTACGTITTDAERLRTALVNLLTNARASLEGRSNAQSPVVLESRRHGPRVTLTVRDQGAGIAPDDLGRIFDPYFTTRRTGSGLGLPIVKNVVEGLGGTIRVASEVNVGTAMTIELGDGPAEAVRR